MSMSIENGKVIKDGKDQAGRHRFVTLDNVGGPVNTIAIVTFSESHRGQGKVTWLSPNGNNSTVYDIDVARRVVAEYDEWLEFLSDKPAL